MDAECSMPASWPLAADALRCRERCCLAQQCSRCVAAAAPRGARHAVPLAGPCAAGKAAYEGWRIPPP